MTYCLPNADHPPVAAMFNATYYRAYGLDLYAVGDPNNVQHVTQADGTVISGVASVNHRGDQVEVVTADGKTARFDAGLIEWFDADGTVSPNSNSNRPVYFGEPVIAA